MLGGFNFPTPFGGQFVQPDILGGGKFPGGYITPKNPIGDQKISCSTSEGGFSGTITHDILGNPVITYHDVWKNPLPPRMSGE